MMMIMSVHCCKVPIVSIWFLYFFSNQGTNGNFLIRRHANKAIVTWNCRICKNKVTNRCLCSTQSQSIYKTLLAQTGAKVVVILQRCSFFIDSFLSYRFASFTQMNIIYINNNKYLIHFILNGNQIVFLFIYTSDI